MRELYIEARPDSPEIKLDKNNAVFQISGKSLPEDAASFYQSVIEWLELYKTDPLETTVFIIKLEYFNTSSSKMILDIFNQLEEIKEEGHNVEINWYYPDYDEEMEDAGAEYAEMVNLHFNYISYDPDEE